MKFTALAWLFGVTPAEPELDIEGPLVSDHVLGVLAFTGVYFVLLLWLFFMPSRLLDEPAGRPWWKSSRLWAITIAAIQILVYLGLG